MNLLCALHWSFTFLATCSSAYEIGIQYDVPFADLISAGCYKCYRAILTSATKPSDITSCVGPYLFVGTQSFDNVTFVVGAYAPAAEVQKSTSLSNPRLSHGLYWHFDEKKAFGFSINRYDRVGMISDSRRGYESDVGPARDLFWSLDQTHLRHKFSAKSPSNQSKWILNCPG